MDNNAMKAITVIPPGRQIFNVYAILIIGNDLTGGLLHRTMPNIAIFIPLSSVKNLLVYVLKANLFWI